MLMRNGETTRRFEVTKYHIRQLLPATDLVAVYCNSDGSYFRDPIICWALATERTQPRVAYKVNGDTRFRNDGPAGLRRCVVPLVHDSFASELQPPMLMGNFIGVCGTNEDPIAIFADEFEEYMRERRERDRNAKPTHSAVDVEL